MIKRWFYRLLNERINTMTSPLINEINYINKWVGCLNDSLEATNKTLESKIRSLETKLGIYQKKLESIKQNDSDEYITTKIEESINNSITPKIEESVNYFYEVHREEYKNALAMLRERRTRIFEDLLRAQTEFQGKSNDYYHNLLKAFRTTINGLDPEKLSQRIEKLEVKQRIASYDDAERAADKAEA